MFHNNVNKNNYYEYHIKIDYFNLIINNFNEYIQTTVFSKQLSQFTNITYLLALNYLIISII